MSQVSTYLTQDLGHLGLVPGSTHSRKVGIIKLSNKASQNGGVKGKRDLKVKQII